MSRIGGNWTYLEVIVLNVSERAMSSEEFRKLAIRITKYVDFKGCGMNEKKLTRRLLDKHSDNLTRLAEAGFGWRLEFEARWFPHEDYKKILGISDDDYQHYLDDYEENRESGECAVAHWKLDNDLKAAWDKEYLTKEERKSFKKKLDELDKWNKRIN